MFVGGVVNHHYLISVQAVPRTNEKVAMQPGSESYSGVQSQITATGGVHVVAQIITVNKIWQMPEHTFVWYVLPFYKRRLLKEHCH